MATRPTRTASRKLWVSKKGPVFKIGKIPPSILKRTVYPYTTKNDSRLLVSPGIGIDAVAIKNSNSRGLVFKTDPITGTTNHIGSHSVIVNANDIATTGAQPVWYLATLFLPLGSKESDLHEIMEDMDAACSQLNIGLIGGHCEVTPGITRPIISGFMIGETKQHPLTSRNAREDDVVLMTKTAGLEGTVILASDYREDLKGIPANILENARSLGKNLSITNEALSIARVQGVHALHDPTEGGILNGLWEIAEASGHGIEVYTEKIPISRETSIICSKMHLDPLRLMSSGCLLATVASTSQPKVSHILDRLHIENSIIGRMVSAKKGRWLVRGNRRTRLHSIVQDELYKLA